MCNPSSPRSGGSYSALFAPCCCCRLGSLLRSVFRRWVGLPDWVRFPRPHLHWGLVRLGRGNRAQYGNPAAGSSSSRATRGEGVELRAGLMGRNLGLQGLPDWAGFVSPIWQPCGEPDQPPVLHIMIKYTFNRQD